MWYIYCHSLKTTFAMPYSIYKRVYMPKRACNLLLVNIMITNKEYYRQKRKEEMESMAKENTYLAKASTSKIEPVTITGRQVKCKKCAVCRYKNHRTADCQLKEKLKCKYCKKYYHTVDECRKLKWDKEKVSEAQSAKKGKAKMVALALAKDVEVQQGKSWLAAKHADQSVRTIY
jgi:hypothetical protein